MNATDDIDSSSAALAYGAALLSGEAVSLRATTDADLETLAQWWQSADWAVLQQTTVKPRPWADIVEMMRGWSANDSASGAGFSVVDSGGRLVGHATLFGAALPARIATYAVIIGPDFTGRGYGTDATRLMLRYAFRELGVHKVELRVWAYNDRAIRAYEKAGFRREGVRRAAAFHGGAFQDEVLMGVLEDEYWASV
jgi:RimJ/RimL family protein N-acetyltransferase